MKILTYTSCLRAYEREGIIEICITDLPDYIINDDANHGLERLHSFYFSYLNLASSGSDYGVGSRK